MCVCVCLLCVFVVSVGVAVVAVLVFDDARMMYQKAVVLISCIWVEAHQGPLSANRKWHSDVAVAGFLSRFLTGSWI